MLNVIDLTNWFVRVDDALFSMHIAGSVDKELLPAAIGVTETGRKRVLGLLAGDKGGNYRDRAMSR